MVKALLGAKTERRKTAAKLQSLVELGQQIIGDVFW
jgi:hypothetical protein